jgi:hypothetical protein
MTDSERDKYIRKSSVQFWKNYKNWLTEEKGFDFDDFCQEVWWRLLENNKSVEDMRFGSMVNKYLRKICGLDNNGKRSIRGDVSYNESVHY